MICDFVVVCWNDSSNNHVLYHGMINICAAQKCPQFSLADSQHAPIQLFGNPKTNTSYGYCLLFTTFHLSKKIVRHRQNTDRLKRRNHICNQQLKYINGDMYMTGKRISLEQQLSGIFINSFANTQQHFTVADRMVFFSSYGIFVLFWCCFSDCKSHASNNVSDCICFCSARCNANKLIGYVIVDSWFSASTLKRQKYRNTIQMKHLNRMHMSTHFSLFFFSALTIWRCLWISDSEHGNFHLDFRCDFD